MKTLNACYLINRVKHVPFVFVFLFVLPSCAQSDQSVKIDTASSQEVEKIDKTDKEWKKELTPEEYNILREHGTEPRYSSDLLEIKKRGTYVCAGCGFPLFSSEAKFKSGTGWPSFYAPLNDYCIEYQEDQSYGMVRSEVHCARCGGHQGHVFDDGPEPTGLRYCINGLALDFVPGEK